jgi:serine/threonine-protein kinase RsbW
MTSRSRDDTPAVPNSREATDGSTNERPPMDAAVPAGPAAVLEELQAVQRSQEFLLRASDVLARVSGFSQTMHALADVAVPDLGDLCLIDVLDRSGELKRIVARHADPTRQHLADELQRNYPPVAGGAHPGARGIATGQAHWSPTMSEDFLIATTRDARHLALIKELGFAGYISVPLIAEGETLGSVTLVSAGSGRVFSERDHLLAQDLASRVALVVAKERRYDEEHRVAHLLQASLLPPVMHSPFVDVAARYVPGNRDAEVGGDFYDLVALPSGRIAFCVGDVAGHDLAAATAMGQLRSAFRALTVHATDPASMVDLLHNSWEALATATVLFAEYDPDSHELLVASAGHPPPILVNDAGATFLPLDPGAPLGAPATPAPLWRGTLASGDVLISYTDGLVEDRHHDIDVGMSELKTAAANAIDREPQALADELLAVLISDELSDDVALLVVRAK